MDASLTRPGSLPAAPTDNAQTAKGALRRLALDKLEPTPENYARAWRQELGEPPAPPEGAAIAYAVTTHRCGSQPDAVWAMDLTNPQKAVTAFNVGDAVIAGTFLCVCLGRCGHGVSLIIPRSACSNAATG